MKISKKEVDKMIKEEFQKMWKKRTLSKRLAEINESLKAMDSEDSLLSEVEAGGMQKTSSATGLVPGEQPKPKFEKLNSTTLKEDEMEGEENSGADMGLNINVDTPESEEMATSTETTPMGEFEAKFAELGKFIDAKLASEDSVAHVPNEMSDDSDKEVGSEPDSDDFEEVEVDSSEDEASKENGETGAEDSEKEEFDEVKEAVVSEMEKTEEEGIDGESVAQKTELSDPDGDMKKDTVVSESTNAKTKVITEAKKNEKKNIFLEGKDPAKQALFLAEQKRMRKFAGLSKDEEEEE